MSVRWTAVEALFFELVELEPAARAQRLVERCPDDRGLRAEVEALLAADGEAARLIVPPGGRTLAEAWAAATERGTGHVEPRAGLEVGAWVLEAPIGRGGMASVWRARRRDASFAQPAAIKLVHAESSARVLARFVQERRALSRLEHPNIARLLDGGALDDGRPFLVMELVEGRTIDRWCDERALGLRARIELFVEVCAAVEYAHRNLIVHRDLKPANVLVSKEGRPKLLDFGIAKVLEADDGLALRTQSDERLLTPRYASPEQVRGEGVSTASDVYSLGVVLHELLTGAGPYAASATRAHELARAIGELPPARPSTVALQGEGAEERARRRGTHARELARALAGDLDAVVLMALRKEPERRYASVERLADDLRHHLAGLPVAAEGERLAYRARKFVARHRVGVAATAIAVLLLAGTAVLAGVSARTAHARLSEVTRLSVLKRIADEQAAAERLWPARPARVPEMEQWLARVRELVGRLPEHTAALERLRERALDHDDAQAAHDRSTHPRAADLEAAHVRRASTQWRLEHSSGDPRDLEARLAELDGEIERLERATAERRTWRFAETADQWAHDELVNVVAGLEVLARPATGLLARVEARAATARSLAATTGDDYAEAWRAATEALAERGRALAPQVGLVPLGSDPGSGLWEFADAQTGRIPSRDGSGRLEIDGETGLVFVLLPGGNGRIGAAQAAGGGLAGDADALARADEQPVHEVELAPFFLSKYEMTQGQWLRFAGSNPSAHAPGQRHGDHLIDLRHPVEHMSWNEAELVLGRLGFQLPTEAQWEYAARAGTRTPWWTGAERESLAGAANIADAAAGRAGAPWPAIHDWPEYDDGHVVHAPVGTFAANAFGLHEVSGNVWEWCRDEYARYDLPTEPGSGLRLWRGARERAGRGGSYLEGAASSRVAHRGHAVLEAREATIGVRPARSVE